MLLVFVTVDFDHGLAIETDSSPVSDDDSRVKKFIKGLGENVIESSAVRSGQFSVLLDPPGLNFSVRDDEDCLLKSLLKFGDVLLEGRAGQDFVVSVADNDKNERLVFSVADFLDLMDEDGLSEFLAVSVEVISSFDDG